MSGKTRKNIPHPRQYDFVIERMKTFGNSQEAIPTRLTLLRLDPLDSSQDQLFLDQMPIPREAWSYDVADRVISWRGAFDGGHLRVSHDGLGAYGNIGVGHNPCSVAAGARAVFDCDVALNTGATSESSGGNDIAYEWDPTSQAWKSAKWDKKRLRLTYTYTPGGNSAPGTCTFEFDDNETGALPWKLTKGFACTLNLGDHNGSMVWNLTFALSGGDPPEDGDSSNSPDSVYPYLMQAVEDAAAENINGVLLIDAADATGTLVGMQGVRATPVAAGYFRTAPENAPFGIFDGKLVIGGQAVATSSLSGTVVSWNDLEPQHQQRTGLPASGTLQFSRDGLLTASSSAQSVMAQRLTTPDTLAAIEQHNDLYADVHSRVKALRQTLDDQWMTIDGLLAMNPFVQNMQNGKAVWGDAVQADVTQDLSAIMHSGIPSNMWNLLFPNRKQPTLTGDLAMIAASPVDGVDDPKAWYGTLATAVLTQGMAQGSDPNCKNMNGPRAAQWLKAHVAASPVYHQHGQLLFNYEWQNRFQLTSQYLADQINNKDHWAPAIEGIVNTRIADIQQNVIPDPSNPTLIQDLIAQVQAVGLYAKTKNLYWAFTYFTYNTAPSLLGTITMGLRMHTANSDGTALTRLLQQNASVLTALDPSGYFTRQYMSTMNIFMATNVVPTMFGFLGDAMSFDLIKEYLQQFVLNNLNNEDTQIAAAAARIQAILAERDSDEMLKACIVALRNLSGAAQEFLALPFVANKFLKWFQTAYPKFSKTGELFGSILIGGITGLAIFNLFTEFKNWSKLSAAEKTQLILNTLQLGLQIVAAVVKRGVRIYAIFDVDGLTAAQRTAAISNILATGEADGVEEGLMRIGNTTSRWLADTEGTIGKTEIELFGFTTIAVNKEVSWASKIFGKNLDEFVSTRIGPVFVLAGIGLSLYFIIHNHETGLALASDILSVTAGSLMLFAQIGAWAIAEDGTILGSEALAGFFTAAGPLGIIAALVGVGIMLYEMFKTPPDPVQEFVDQYVKPTEFYVPSQSTAIDYATNYINPDQNKLLMIGFSLTSQEKSLTVKPSGSVGVVSATTTLPDCIWQAVTDGSGLSKIATVVQPDTTKPADVVWLSLMSDNTVSFQPPMPRPKLKSSKPRAATPMTDAPTVLTQTWLSAPQGNANVTSSGGFLASLKLTFQPVLPDGKGIYTRTQAKGWLVQTSSGAGYDPAAGSTFTLNMSGMSPNYMRMMDLSFQLNSEPKIQQAFAPAFGVNPSMPITFTVTGALPTFLTFSAETGTFRPNGAKATLASEATYSVTAKNTVLGQEKSVAAKFKITVAAAPKTSSTSDR
jgi:hypothetical protein